MDNILKIESFFKILSCPICFSENLNLQANKLVCFKCGASFDINNEKVFFTKPVDDFAEKITPNHFNKKKWSNWRKANFEYFKNYLINAPSSNSILDLGAGPSQFRELTGRFSLSLSMDFRPLELINVVGDLTKRLPFKNEIFDIVMLSNTIEHIPNTEFLFSDIQRILKPGGFVIGTIPFLMRVHQKPYDYNRYTYFMLERILENASFKKNKVESLGKSVDVYESIQTHFFYYLLSATFSKNKLINTFKKFVARVVWRMQRLFLLLFLSFYKNAVDSPDFAQGYGFMAIKNK